MMCSEWDLNRAGIRDRKNTYFVILLVTAINVNDHGFSAFLHKLLISYHGIIFRGIRIRFVIRRRTIGQLKGEKSEWVTFCAGRPDTKTVRNSMTKSPTYIRFRMPNNGRDLAFDCSVFFELLTKPRIIFSAGLCDCASVH